MMEMRLPSVFTIRLAIGLVKGSLEPPDLFLLLLLGLLILGDIRGGDEHHRIISVMLNLRGTNLPPEPALPAATQDTVGMLHDLSPSESFPQGVQEGVQVIRMDQVGQRLRQRISLRSTSNDAAEAGADINHSGDIPHFQQRHTALHLLQQTAEGDGVDRADVLTACLLVAIPAL